MYNILYKTENYSIITLVRFLIDKLEFDKGIDFMDFLLIALIFVVAATVVVLIAKNIASHKFQCRHCSKAFYVKWPKIIIIEHSGSEYRLVCPFCKVKDWCTEQSKNT